MKEQRDATHISYRPDIDGLRATAVLSVVGCHLQFRFFAGGFVGVDVFFVISGFLIGSILLREVAQTGRIDYRRFYERRIRRIMPAFFAMLIVLAAVSYGMLLPKDLIGVAKMGIASMLFSANIYLARTAGYFGSEAAYNFLLHTWSLGVEEQFYIVLPPLLVLARRIKPTCTGPSLVVIAALSFLVSIPSAYLRPTGTFYLLPTRIWELLAGTLIYLYGKRLKQLPNRVQNLITLAGAIAILLPLPLYTSLTVFPGFAALMPVAGTVLIIGTHATWVHRLLASRVFIFFGQISYSLYLWHWPLVVMNRMYPLLSQGRMLKVTLLAASILLAYASWKWIETPFRFGRYKPTARVLFSGVGVVAAVLLVFFTWATASGAAGRYSPQEQGIASYRQNGGIMEHFRVGQCFLEDGAQTVPERDACLKVDTHRPNVLLLGSSYVAQLHDALQQTFPEINFLQATAPRCAVQLPSEQRAKSGCTALINFLFSEYLPRNHMDAVLFEFEPQDTTQQALDAMLLYLHAQGIAAYVMGPQVRYDQPGPALAISAGRHPDTFRSGAHLTLPASSAIAQEDQLRKLVTSRGGAYLSMYNLLCPQSACRMDAARGIPMETDLVHLTYPGTLYVTSAWHAQGIFNPLLSRTILNTTRYEKKR